MDADYFLKSLRIFNHKFSQMDTNFYQLNLDENLNVFWQVAVDLADHPGGYDTP